MQPHGGIALYKDILANVPESEDNVIFSDLQGNGPKIDDSGLDSALERIPKDENGNPVYEQTDADTAWDAILEQTGGDMDMAMTVVNSMVADKVVALNKAEKAKLKGGATVEVKIAAEKVRVANIEAARREVEAWKGIADVPARRMAEIEAERSRPVGIQQGMSDSVEENGDRGVEEWFGSVYIQFARKAEAYL